MICAARFSGHKEGLLTGTGHHCVVEGPDGQLWAFYTIVYHAWNRMADVDRRIGMDRVGFDKGGEDVHRGADRPRKLRLALWPRRMLPNPFRSPWMRLTK